jgi:hypothetical protein
VGKESHRREEQMGGRRRGKLSGSGLKEKATNRNAKNKENMQEMQPRTRRNRPEWTLTKQTNAYDNRHLKVEEKNKTQRKNWNEGEREKKKKGRKKR